MDQQVLEQLKEIERQRRINEMSSSQHIHNGQIRGRGMTHLRPFVPSKQQQHRFLRSHHTNIPHLLKGEECEQEYKKLVEENRYLTYINNQWKNWYFDNLTDVQKGGHNHKKRTKKRLSKRRKKKSLKKKVSKRRSLRKKVSTLTSRQKKKKINRRI